jgi:hypothetical protein
MRMALDEKFLLGMIAGLALFAGLTYWRGSKV